MQVENVTVHNLIGQVLASTPWVKEWYQAGIIGFNNGSKSWSGDANNQVLNVIQPEVKRIGCGGFDAQGLVHWVGFDLDVDKGQEKQKYATIDEAIAAAMAIRQYVNDAAEIRRSTSGTGVHVRVRLATPIAGGKEKAKQLASIIAKDCSVKCDPSALGTQLFWFWAKDTAEDSFQLIEPCIGAWTPPKAESTDSAICGQPAKQASSETIERAEKYIAKMGPCVSGHGGDSHLYKVAVSLICGFDIPHAKALELMRKYNKSCQPPWSEDRLIYKLNEAAKLTSTRGYLLDAQNLNLQEVANAFLHDSGYGDFNNATLRFWHGQFYRYNGYCYREFPVDDLNAQIVKFLREINRVPNAISGYLTNIQKLMQALLNIETSTKPGSFIKSGTENKNLISVRNGLLDIGNRELRQHTPDFFTLTSLPFEYDQNAKCEKWLTFLSQVQPEQECRDILQEWFGLNLVYDTTFEKFMLLIGEGSNGKSVVTDVMKYLIGDGNYSSLSLDQFDSGRTFPLASTQGKLSNICPDLRKISDFDEGTLKKFVSGEVISVEQKGKDPFEMAPTARLTFSCNQKPLIQDKTNGVWRRLLAVLFSETFSCERINRQLKTKEYWIDELPGILNWALDGLARLRNNKIGFTTSKTSEALIQEYKKECNYTLEFLSDCIVPKNNNFTSKCTLYNVYETYMRKFGYKPLGQKNFYQELRKMFSQSEECKQNGERGFRNIGFSDEGIRLITGQVGQIRDSRMMPSVPYNPYQGNN